MKLTALSDIVQRLSMERELKHGRSVRDLFDRWDEIVGEPISKFARPASLFNGTLLLAAETSTAAQEASFALTTYIARINQYLGPNAVRAVRIENRGKKVSRQRRRRAFRPSSAPKPDLSGIELTAEERADIQSLAADIQNPEVRRAVERAAAARLKRQKWDARRRRSRPSRASRNRQ